MTPATTVNPTATTTTTTAAAPVSTDPGKPEPGLSRDEVNELYNASFDLNPKNFEVSISYTPEPEFTVSILPKITFCTIEVNEDVVGSEGTAKPKFIGEVKPKEFSKHHLLPIPTIRSMNGAEPEDATGVPNLKPLSFKSQEDKKKLEELEALCKRVTVNENGYTFKVVKYQVTQRYWFKIPFLGYTFNARHFPLDEHKVQLSLIFDPIKPVKVGDLLQLRAGETKKEENFYPKLNVKNFPSNAAVFARENILEFDFGPNSLRCKPCVHNSGASKKVAINISFTLFRKVLGPFMNVLLPIYVLDLLIPFAAFFRLDEGYGDVAAYLSTLLLTLVAHRQIMADSLEAVTSFTWCDFDFFLCFVGIILQMSLFVFMVNLEDGEESILQIDNIWLFAVEEIVVVLWFLFRLNFVRRAHSMSSDEAFVDVSKLENDPISMGEYMSLQHSRHLFGLDELVRIERKTFLSSNLKIIACSHFQHKTKHKRLGAATNDIFRCRLYKSKSRKKETLQVLKKLNGVHSAFAKEYTKKNISKEDKQLQRESSETEFEKGKTKVNASKIVYSFTGKNKVLLLEVQFLENENDVWSDEEHLEFKRDRLTPGLLRHIKKSSVNFLYFQSLLLELYRFYENGAWERISYDWKLRRMVLDLLDDDKEPKIVEKTSTEELQELGLGDEYKGELDELKDLFDFKKKE